MGGPGGHCQGMNCLPYRASGEILVVPDGLRPSTFSGRLVYKHQTHAHLIGVAWLVIIILSHFESVRLSGDCKHFVLFPAAPGCQGLTWFHLERPQLHQTTDSWNWGG